MLFNTVDIYSIVVILVLFLLFFLGLKSETKESKNQLITLDLNFSIALKAISCIFILLGHFMSYYYNRQPDSIVSKVIFYSTANIALVIFMFCSGYGLSIKNYAENINIRKIFTNRIGKIILPFFIVIVATHILYLVLPNIFSDSFLVKYRLPLLTGKIADFFNNNTLPRLRYRDWYVECIIMFYSIFYFALYLSKKRNMCLTYVLFVLLSIYYIAAVFTIDSEYAHYYRYPWAFFSGHVAARITYYNALERKIVLVLLGLSLFTLLESYICTIVGVVSLIIIYIVSRLNQKYIFNGKILLWLGSISYLFYLCHERICWLLLAYTKIINPILWILITIVISYFFNCLYKLIQKHV